MHQRTGNRRHARPAGRGAAPPGLWPHTGLMRARDFPFFDTRFAAFAHRGGATYEPNAGRENTLAAFRTAVGLGYRYLETDVHATRDGRLIAFHDDRLDRLTDLRGRVADLTAADISHARVGGTEPVPTLDALLEAFPDARFNLDLKSSAAVEPLVRTIEWHRAHDRVCVASFDVARLRAFRRLMGRRVPTVVSAAGIVYNAYVPVAPRLFNSPGVTFQLPVSQRFRGREVRALTPRLVAHAHATGKVVHVWTIDDPAQMEELIDRGVDGIFTDRIDLLKDVLQRRGLWEGTA